jgi:DNA-binding CsgD family transcriptional regulator
MTCSYVRTDDTRALVRLAGEVRELSAANKETTPHMLRELAKITHSAVAMEFTAWIRPGENYKLLRAVDYGWRSDTDRARVYDYCLSLSLGDDVLLAEAMRRPQPVATLVRSDVVSNRDWARTVLYNEIYVPSGIEDSLVSVLKLDDRGDVRALIFKRAPKGGAYAERERDLLDIFLSECQWLYAAPPPRELPPSRTENFSRRELQVLEILLTGAPEKQVAGLLGVSRNTAHQYVKSIYRKLSVTSRPQLMAEVASLAKIPRSA